MTIDNLEIQIKSSSEQASQGINKLAASLTTLKQVAKGGAGLGTVANQISKLNTALAGITAPTAKIQSMVNAINRLSSVSTKASTKSEGLASVVKQLNKLPKVAQALKATDMDGFATAINRVTTAIKPLATEMEKVSNGFSALPTRIQKVITQNERLTASNRKTGKSYGILGTGVQGWAARLMTATFTARAIGNAIGGWIQKSNAYVENLNLFTVALGNYAEEAKDYAETVGELMGIDPSDWLRAQGVFNTLATGFGITSDKAAIMSKNLTQLSYDLSSFYNINVSDAMTKLQSAFSGELEPVRRLGYDLSQTKLQAIAASKGITKNIADMNQAEKSMLRYYALMTQVTTAQGDMARTLNAPSNQLRIFNAQLAQAQRALGNIFIPALNAVLPYLIAFLKVLRMVANEIARLFNYELPEIDYSNVNEIGSGISDNLDEATASAKKLKNAVGGFDELNILSQDDGGDGAGLGGVGFDLEVPEYNFLEGLTESKASEIAKKLEEPFREILKLVGLIGAAMLTWKVGTGVYNFINTLQAMLATTSGAVTLGVTLSIIGLVTEFVGLQDAFQNSFDEINFAEIIGGGTGITLAGAVIGKKFGNAVLGAGIGAIIAGVPAFFVGIRDAILNGFTGFNLAETTISGGAVVGGAAAIGAKLGSAVIGGAIGGIITGLPTFVAGIIDAVTNKIDIFNSIAIALGATATGAGVGAIIGAVGGPIGAGIGALIGLIVGALTDLGILIYQNWDAIWTTVKDLATTAWEGIKTFFTQTIPEIINNITTWFSELPGKIAYHLGFIIGKLKAWKENAITWIKTEVPKIIENVVTWFSGLPAKIKEKIDLIKNTITEWRQGIMEWIDVELPKIINNIIDWFTKLPDALVNVGKNMIYGLWNGILSVGSWLKNKIASYFGDMWEVVSEAVGSFGSGVEAGYASVPKYATGGFPTTGSMFIANEAGPELVGRIGTRTAVANQDQITEGIAQAVYNAMMSANQSGGNQNINLFIDGKQVNAAVEKAKREKGTSIMTGGLIYG